MAWRILAPAIGVATFLLAGMLPNRRTIVYLAGAVLVSALGLSIGKLPESHILGSIQNAVPVLLLIVELEIFSLAMREIGLLDALLSRVLALSDTISTRLLGGRIRSEILAVMLILLLTYIVSCFMNNLAAILVIVPLVLEMSVHLKIPAKPFIVVLVIVSNMGGASTRIGDFPNMIIASQANVDFLAFLVNLGLPIVLILLPLLLGWYYARHLRKFELPYSAHLEAALFRHCLRTMDYSSASRNLVFIAVLATMIVAFLLITVDPALVGGFFAVILLLLLGKGEAILRRIDVGVLGLFLALFLIAGAIESTGMFGELTGALLTHLGSAPRLLALALLGIGALTTALFSAGPSTAMLVGFTATVGTAIPGNIEWWILSFGVLAGSSATLIGATAGPVAASLFEERCRERFSFWQFSRIGIGAALVILVLGATYILLRT